MADIVGTAYVRIKAITAGLAGDIKDGIDKGVKDAKGDISKAGQDSGDSYKEGVGKSLSDGDMGKSIGNAWNPPDAKDRVGGAGEEHTKHYSDGVDKETKRRNPFTAILTSFKSFSKDLNKNVDRDTDKKGAFGKLFGALDSLADKIHIPKIAWGAILAPDVLGGIASAIGAALAGITAGLGYLVQAAAGAGVALGGVLAVAVPGLAVLLAAFKANTEELEAFKESAKELLEPFKEIASATQKTLFPGILDALETLQQLIPTLSTFGSQLGGIVGGMAAFAAKILVDPKNMEALGVILENSLGFFQTMGTAGLEVLDAMLPLFVVMAPLAQQLADSLLKMAQHFNDFINAKSATGELTATFQGWYDKFVVIAGILGDVAVGLWNILSIAGDSDLAGDMFGGLADSADRFRRWTESLSGQNALKQWFADAQPFLHEAWLLLKDIADIVIGPVFEGDFSGPTEFVKTVREDWLPVFERLGEALSDRGIGDALLHLADSLVLLLDATAGSGTFVTVIEGIAEVIELLATVMANPIVTEITKNLIFLAVGFKAVSMVLGPLKVLGTGGFLLGFAEGLLGMGSASATASPMFFALGTALTSVVWPLLAIAAAIAAVIAVWYFWDEINAGLAAAWGWFTKLSTPMKVFVGFLVLIAGPIVAVAAGLYALVWALKHWREILEALQVAWDAMLQFFRDLPELIQNLPQLLQNVADSLLEFLTGLPGMLSGVWEALKQGVLDALTNLPNLILDALGALGDLGMLLIGLIADGLQAALPALARALGELPGLLFQAFTGLAELMFDVGITILKFLVEGLIQYLPKVLVFLATLPFRIIGFGIQMGIALGKGLIQAWPRILQWFQDLPGNLLDAVVGAAQWLWATGRLVLSGFLKGIQNSWATISAWFAELPGRIMGALPGIGNWLMEQGGALMQGFLDGVMTVWASINEAFLGFPQIVLNFFLSLPGLVGNALSSFVSTVIGYFQDLFMQLVGASIVPDMINAIVEWFFKLPIMAVEALAGMVETITQPFLDMAITIVNSVMGWVTDAVAFYAGLPAKALAAIGNLGMTIWNAISGGFTTAYNNVKSWVTDVWNKLTEFATQVPGKVAGLVTSLPGKIGEATTAALTKISTWVTDALTKFGNFVSDVPGKFSGLMSSIVSSIGSALDAGLTRIGTWVTQALNKVGEFVTGIPGKLSGALGSLTSGISSLLRRAWNSAVDGLPSIHFDLPGPIPGSINIDPSSVLKMQMGGIIPGSALGIPVIVGERFHREAIVPMERPGRALSVMQAAGLDRLVLDAYLHGKVPGERPAAQSGPTTMLAIDKAVFQAPVDADMVVQKITQAYRRMAS